MRIRVEEFARQGVLAGADAGRTAFAEMLARTARNPIEPELVLLDFAGIEVATASFLREAVFVLRNVVRQTNSNYYPVICNAASLILEELRILAKPMGTAIFVFGPGAEGSEDELQILGELELKQKLTLELVDARGETDAAELMKATEEPIGQTAWNNRLAGLVQMGLIAEVSNGRAKRYRSLKGGFAIWD